MVRRATRLGWAAWLCLFGAGLASAQVPEAFTLLDQGGHLTPTDLSSDALDKLAREYGSGCAQQQAYRYRQPQAATDAVNRWLAARGYHAEALGGGERSSVWTAQASGRPGLLGAYVREAQDGAGVLLVCQIAAGASRRPSGEAGGLPLLGKSGFKWLALLFSGVIGGAIMRGSFARSPFDPENDR